jgi:hypothetical protein
VRLADGCHTGRWGGADKMGGLTGSVLGGISDPPESQSIAPRWLERPQQASLPIRLSVGRSEPVGVVDSG